MRPSRAGREAPHVLCIGGLEGTGRMGLLADAEAVRARGGVPVLVATAVTAQGPRTFRVAPVDASALRAQVRAARELGAVDAVKVGLVVDRRQASALVRALDGLRVPWVVDPVVRASSGRRLSGLRPEDVGLLAGPRRWLTPNAGEAEVLTGRPVGSVVQAVLAARALAEAGWGGVLLKGGHLAGPTVVDALAWRGDLRTLEARRLPRGADRRGTGCRLASALATELGRGVDGPTAVGLARDLVRAYLRPGGSRGGAEAVSRLRLNRRGRGSRTE